jgi:hypothetical protein
LLEQDGAGGGDAGEVLFMGLAGNQVTERDVAFRLASGLVEGGPGAGNRGVDLRQRDGEARTVDDE